MNTATRRRLLPWLIGLGVALVVLAYGYAPTIHRALSRPEPVGAPQFPSTVASYSWYTGMLSSARFEAATLLYQNGVGVEFMDTPQSVLLSADGSTYRRLDEAEAASIAEDQGDPATTVLSPDGTFVVIGSAGRTGEIEVVSLRDGRSRSVSLRGARTGLPIAIGADGRTVLLATSEDVVDRYAEPLELGLASVDLQSGELRDYPTVRGVQGAALSPDNRRIVVATNSGTMIIDSGSGRVAAELTAASEVRLDGDAWSPDGRRIAFVDDASLVVVDPSGPTPTRQRLLLAQGEYATVLGWRDESTVLVHAFTNSGENTSELYWTDVHTGRQQSFSTYTPNFTGASLLGADAARDLIPRWQVADRPVDRGPRPFGVVAAPAIASAVLGLLAVIISRRLVRTAPGGREATRRDGTDAMLGGRESVSSRRSS